MRRKKSPALADTADNQGFVGLSDGEGREWASRWTTLGYAIINGEFGAVTWAPDKPGTRLPLNFTGSMRTDAPYATPGIGFESDDKE